jgi:hypothetical protein
VGRNGFPEPLGPLDQGLDEPLHPLSRLFIKQLAVLVEAFACVLNEHPRLEHRVGRSVQQNLTQHHLGGRS